MAALDSQARAGPRVRRTEPSAGSSRHSPSVPIAGRSRGTEQDELIAFYQALRQKDELGHEDAIRDSVASILMSPHFCYRLEPVAAGAATRPLSDHALASRLSYFLWSSMPDAELLAHAAAGDLHQPDVLVTQAKRMLRDEKVRGLATEFAGNWLAFRRFEEHNAVDRQRFPSFTAELRQAMYEEPIRFFVDLVSQNRSVLELLYANYTFVNPTLAKFYGMTVPKTGPQRLGPYRRRGPLRPGGPVADVGFLDGQLAGFAHQSRQAWLLGRPPLAG